MTLLEIRNLSVSFKTRQGAFQAVQGVRFNRHRKPNRRHCR